MFSALAAAVMLFALIMYIFAAGFKYSALFATLSAASGAFAAALIDQCGLRGYRHGGAAVSEKHCGFVVNLGGATCADVLALCDEVRAVVKEKTGYDLEKEIRVVKA